MINCKICEPVIIFHLLPLAISMSLLSYSDYMDSSACSIALCLANCSSTMVILSSYLLGSSPAPGDSPADDLADEKEQYDGSTIDVGSRNGALDSLDGKTISLQTYEIANMAAMSPYVPITKTRILRNWTRSSKTRIDKSLGCPSSSATNTNLSLPETAVMVFD